MLARLYRWFKRGLIILFVIILILLAPATYVEFGCREPMAERDYNAILAPKHHRNLAASFLTYPEWNIVHAYDDYAAVIETRDPHEFGFLRAIRQFWSSACSLSKIADQNGGADQATKQTMYVIGVSFTAELLAKAAYEETIGRVFAILRGSERSKLDNLSAKMARTYATFLQQVPWYKYDFQTDRAQLHSESEGSVRDTERRFALGTEFAVKTVYAGVIGNAVSATGEAALTIRTVIDGMTESKLKSIKDVTIIGTTPYGIEIETPRYRVFTKILQEIARFGGSPIEIAGNDRIMLSAISSQQEFGKGFFEIARQGHGDYRYLFNVPMSELSQTIENMRHSKTMRLEHIYDY